MTGDSEGGNHPKSVQRVLDAAAEHGLTLELVEYPDGTRTAVDAAAAVGCDVGQIVKSLIFAVDGELVLALTSGANQVDTDALTGRRTDHSVDEPTPIRFARPPVLRSVELHPSATSRPYRHSSTQRCSPTKTCGLPQEPRVTCSRLHHEPCSRSPALNSTTSPRASSGRRRAGRRRPRVGPGRVPYGRGFRAS